MLSYLKNKISNYLYSVFKNRLQEEEWERIEALKKSFKKVGENFTIAKDFRIPDPRNIEIGDNFRASDRFRADVFVEINGEPTHSRLIIGDNVVFQTDVHIACANKIEIGNGCLFASRIFISDHSHGKTDVESISIPPQERPIYSAGEIIIGKNVWVGEGVAILPNVKIGENAIIGANAVVTKDVPKNAVVAGIPARVIKMIS